MERFISRPVSPSIWRNLNVSLFRFSDGSSPGKVTGSFHAVRLTAWRMQSGTAELEIQGIRVRAERDQWLICLPGMRVQQLSADARYVSLHYTVESSPELGVWSGCRAIHFDTVPEIERALKELKISTIIRRMGKSSLIYPQEIPATFQEHLCLQQRSLRFFEVLSALLEKQSVHYQILPIMNSRVRASYAALTEDDFKTPFSRRDLAKSHGLSTSQMDRLWKQHLGLTPQSYLDRRRLKQACILLESMSHSIKEIAHETGFRHLSRFCIWFKKRTGCSPGLFRQQARRRD